MISNSICYKLLDAIEMAKYITSSIPCIIVEDDTEPSNIYKVATAEYELINT